MSKRRKLSHSGPPEIAAIPTSYNGVQFKSRIEARWAIVFDLLGINWRYEPIKIALGESMYIPDFLLDGPGYSAPILIEIKGREASTVEIEKIAALNGESELFSMCVLVSGAINKHRMVTAYTGYYTAGIAEREVTLRQCPFCGHVGVGDHNSDEGAVVPHGHDYCNGVEEFAQHYDIDNGFWDWEPTRRPKMEIVSPIIDIALSAAHSVSFDSPYLHQTVAAAKKQTDLLLAHQVYAGSRFLTDLHFYGLYCKRLNGAPKYRPCFYSQDFGQTSFSVHETGVGQFEGISFRRPAEEQTTQGVI